ncbi:hypothetical protein ACFQJ7_15410 [Halovenus rubra]|uniref:Halobacterial output domain-containing protein n=2 Tax=Halovenus rubra TaxID=869890 RepID=A0ABD5X813_9EURY|nr:hypothetical protein [Halovenus rubra]
MLEQTSDDRAAFENAFDTVFPTHSVDTLNPDYIRNFVYDGTVSYVVAVCNSFDFDVDVS